MLTYFKRSTAILLTVLMLLALCACSSGTGNKDNNTEAPRSATPKPDVIPDNSIRLYFTVDARSAVDSGLLSPDDIQQLNGNGLLMNNAAITLPRDSVFSNLFHVLELYGIPVVTGNEGGVKRVTEVKGIANGACGESSYWMLIVNGSAVEESADTLRFESGDVVRLFFTVNGGADAEAYAPGK